MKSHMWRFQKNPSIFVFSIHAPINNARISTKKLLVFLICNNICMDCVDSDSFKIFLGGIRPTFNDMFNGRCDLGDCIQEVTDEIIETTKKKTDCSRCGRFLVDQEQSKMVVIAGRSCFAGVVEFEQGQISDEIIQNAADLVENKYSTRLQSIVINSTIPKIPMGPKADKPFLYTSIHHLGMDLFTKIRNVDGLDLKGYHSRRLFRIFNGHKIARKSYRTFSTLSFQFHRL